MSYSDKEFEELKKERDILWERKLQDKKLVETLFQLRREYMAVIGELQLKTKIIEEQRKDIEFLKNKVYGK